MFGKIYFSLLFKLELFTLVFVINHLAGRVRTNMQIRAVKGCWQSKIKRKDDCHEKEIGGVFKISFCSSERGVQWPGENAEAQFRVGIITRNCKLGQNWFFHGEEGNHSRRVCVCLSTPHYFES